jgi:hypothetical protein
MIQGILVKQHFLAGCLVIKDWDRNTPRTLTRDAPVTSAGDKRFDSILADIRDPLDLWIREI